MAPPSPAVVTMELQRGVCGDLASIELLADAVTELGVDVAAARLTRAARAAGVPVVHCTFALPVDRRGLDLETPLLAAARGNPDYLLVGTPAVELLAGLGPEPADVVHRRSQGISPFGQSDLDARLRSMGVDHLIVCGVSLNLGIPGLVIEAVNHRYSVTVAADATVGVPVAFGQDVLDNALRFVAKIATVDEIVAGWADGNPNMAEPDDG